MYVPLRTQGWFWCWFFLLNLSIQLCSKDVLSYIGEKQSSNLRVIMILIDVGATRYTGEGMDIMEFTEAESNIQDLM